MDVTAFLSFNEDIIMQILETYKNAVFSGEHKLDKPVKARIKDTEYIRRFFDGTPNYEQVMGLTIGKTYEIKGIYGYGDVSDAIITDDSGQTRTVMLNWFEQVE